MADFKQLQEAAKGFSVLYVEDNDALRKNASKLLQKFFSTVYLGADGVEGLALFKEHRPAIVVTDIKMPRLDGMEMSKKIHHASPDTKIIIMSAFDDKDYLYQAIEEGVFRFIKKPVNVTELSTVLYRAIVHINNEQRERLFQAQLGSIFNYQSSMIAMMKDAKPILANQPFLDFYGVEDIDELNQKFPDLGASFLKHDSFLYSDGSETWLDKILANKDKIYNVKMKNRENKLKHFILKCKDIPEKADHWILSFDDVTDLNLLELFDDNITKKNNTKKSQKAMFEMLEVIQRNSAKVSLHNYYKGISITNDAIIHEIKENSIVLETLYVQQKVIQYENKSLLISEALSHPIACEEIVAFSFDKKLVEFTKMKLVETSPITRANVRLVPEESHSVSMFVEDSKYTGDLSILDISLRSVKLALSTLPAGFDVDTQVRIDMVFTLDKQPLIINTKATLFRKYETAHKFEVVFLFELNPKMRSDLVRYIAKRQMLIIREFKGLQNGK